MTKKPKLERCPWCNKLPYIEAGPGEQLRTVHCCRYFPGLLVTEWTKVGRTLAWNHRARRKK